MIDSVLNLFKEEGEQLPSLEIPEYNKKELQEKNESFPHLELEDLELPELMDIVLP